MIRTRRHTQQPATPPHGAVEVAAPRITGDARVVAGGTVTDQARVGGHAAVIGSAVVAEHAVVTDRTVIAGHARVCGTATVSGHAAAIDGAWVGGAAWMFGHAVIRGLASVGEHAQVFGTALVAGQATVTDQAWIFGAAVVDGQAHIGGRARIGGGRITGTARIEGDIRIRPGTLLGNHADIREPDHVHLIELAHRVHATLYRCTDGRVGAGLPDGWHGPLDMDRLPEELHRHRELVHELAQRWAPQAQPAEPTGNSDQPGQGPGGCVDPDVNGGYSSFGAHRADGAADWVQWAPHPNWWGGPDVRPPV